MRPNWMDALSPSKEEGGGGGGGRREEEDRQAEGRKYGCRFRSSNSSDGGITAAQVYH